MSQIHQPLTDKIRNQSIKLLNQNLANSIDLHAQLKSAIWNVQISGSVNIKRLLEINSKSILDFEDMIGERINSLGGHAFGSIQFASSNSILVPYTVGVASESEHGFAISATLAAYSQAISVAIAVSNKINDFITAELFANILRITDVSLRRFALHLDTHPNSGENEYAKRDILEQTKRYSTLENSI